MMLESMPEMVGLADERERLRARITLQLEELAQEAYDAWHRSCEERQKVRVTRGRTTRGRGGEQVPLPDVEVIEGVPANGDPRYLVQARAALADLRRLWGLDLPRPSFRVQPTAARKAIGREVDHLEELVDAAETTPAADATEPVGTKGDEVNPRSAEGEDAGAGEIASPASETASPEPPPLAPAAATLPPPREDEPGSPPSAEFVPRSRCLQCLAAAERLRRQPVGLPAPPVASSSGGATPERTDRPGAVPGSAGTPARPKGAQGPNGGP